MACVRPGQALRDWRAHALSKLCVIGAVCPGQAYAGRLAGWLLLLSMAVPVPGLAPDGVGALVLGGSACSTAPLGFRQVCTAAAGHCAGLHSGAADALHTPLLALSWARQKNLQRRALAAASSAGHGRGQRICKGLSFERSPPSLSLPLYLNPQFIAACLRCQLAVCTAAVSSPCGVCSCTEHERAA